jgi:hypothetical protein
MERKGPSGSHQGPQRERGPDLLSLTLWALIRLQRTFFIFA